MEFSGLALQDDVHEHASLERELFCQVTGVPLPACKHLEAGQFWFGVTKIRLNQKL